MTWQRARTDEQKEARVDAILAAATDLFSARPFGAISLGQIASKAGFTRPNLYRYFATKEAIFLVLLERDLDAWAASIERRFGTHRSRSTDQRSASAPAPLTPEKFTDAWIAALQDVPRLLDLLPLLSTALEQNISETELRSFKLELLHKIDRVGASVIARYPALDGRFLEFVNINLAMVAGLVPMGRRGETHEKVLADPTLSPFRVEFEPTLRAAIVALLRGYAA